MIEQDIDIDRAEVAYLIRTTGCTEAEAWKVIADRDDARMEAQRIALVRPHIDTEDEGW